MIHFKSLKNKADWSNLLISYQRKTYLQAYLCRMELITLSFLKAHIQHSPKKPLSIFMHFLDIMKIRQPVY